MLGDSDVIATIAGKDIEVAKTFYEGKLGLTRLPSEELDVFVSKSGRSQVLVYQSQYVGTNNAAKSSAFAKPYVCRRARRSGAVSSAGIPSASAGRAEFVA